jgi:uncharacterized integral membrane protein
MLRWVVAVPLLLIMISFALSNRDPVTLWLFPFGELPFDVPLSLAILAAMGLGFVLGGLRLWGQALRHRRAARKAEDAMRLLEAKHQALQARLSSAPRSVIAPAPPVIAPPSPVIATVASPVIAPRPPPGIASAPPVIASVAKQPHSAGDTEVASPRSQ